MTTQQGLTQADLAGLEPEDIVALDRMAAGDRNVARQLIGNILTTRMQERKLGQDWNKEVFRAQTKAEFLADKAKLQRELQDERLNTAKDIAKMRVAASLVQSPEELALLRARTAEALARTENVGNMQDFRERQLDLQGRLIDSKIKELEQAQKFAETKAERDKLNDEVDRLRKMAEVRSLDSGRRIKEKESGIKTGLTKQQILSDYSDDPSYNATVYEYNRNTQEGPLTLDAIATPWLEYDIKMKEINLPPNPKTGTPMTPAQIQKTAEAYGKPLREVLQMVYGKKIAEQITGENFDGYSWNKSK